MRAIAVLLGVVLLALGLLAAPAAAMQPPGEGAQGNFGCVNGRTSPVAGHPGAAGLLHATPMVSTLTGNPMPTAWNAVHRAEPIELGTCE